jgi:cell wall-associated NlpC family hydrolase
MRWLKLSLLLLTFAAQAQSQNPASLTHQVQLGETLWRIGQRYKVTPDHLRQANGLSTDTIRVGQILTIPTSAPPPPAVEPTVIAPVPSEKKPTSSLAPATKTDPSSASPLNTRHSSPTTELRQKFITATRQLAAQKIGYNQSWAPPESRNALDMDCSNTTRWLYRQVTGLDIGRTASDQYYFLRQKQKAWLIPLQADGQADLAILEKYLRPGDLLFWENTYKPVRNIPITHVAIYLGKNEKGQNIMAASQQASEGENHNPRGGPDIYPFYPHRLAGGYRNWVGSWVARGVLVAFGRPLYQVPPTVAASRP